MKEGKKVKGVSWVKNTYARIKDKKLQYFSLDNEWIDIDFSEHIHESFEIVEEKKTLSDKREFARALEYVYYREEFVKEAIKEFLEWMNARENDSYCNYSHAKVKAKETFGERLV